MNQTRNHKAVLHLKELGYPLTNIRRSLPILTGISQVQLAERIQEGRAGVTHIINGQRQENQYVKRKIANVYQVPVDDLFESVE